MIGHTFETERQFTVSARGAGAFEFTIGPLVILLHISSCNSFHVFVEHPRAIMSWVAAVPAHYSFGHIEKIAKQS